MNAQIMLRDTKRLDIVILTGDHAGEQHVAYFQSMQDENGKYHYGVVIPALNDLWLEGHHGHPTPQYPSDFNDLCTPYTANDEEIRVGDSVVYASSNVVQTGVVEKIMPKESDGYGYWIRPLKIRNDATKKIDTQKKPLFIRKGIIQNP